MKFTPWYALDIDDLLSHTAHDRFHELKELFGDPWYDFADLKKHTERVNSVWNDENAQKRIIEKIFDNEYQKTISLFPQSLESVTKLQRKNLFNCYITARPDAIIDGTQHRLEKNWFPALPIIARPPTIPKDKEHLRKAQTLYTLQSEGVIGIIDDQFKLLHQMEQYFPDYQWTLHLLLCTHDDSSIITNINHTISHSREEVAEKLTQ